MDLIDDLSWRGLKADCTDEAGLRERLAGGRITLYCGFDPTADSLHVGHLMGQLMLRRFQLAGHRPIALAGGATGMVGDPSGKSAERNLLSREQLNHNIEKIKAQLQRLLDFDAGAGAALLVDNADWTAPWSYLDFLREIGKHFPLGAMLGKESVRQRLASEAGISYTEFSYQLLQAYDFLHLRQRHDCELQIGGSDQWGNITAGIDLIRRKCGQSAFGWTFPLITRADGSKFGKTEAGTLWLDPKRTSPYRLHQYFLNTEDDRVGEYLRKFTLLPREAIEALEVEQADRPEQRAGQRALAAEVTRLVHGQQALDRAEQAAAILFGAEIDRSDASVLAAIVDDVPRHVLARERLAGAIGLVDLLVESGLCPSRTQARRDLVQQAISVNNERVQDGAASLGPGALIGDRFVLLRKGRKQHVLVDVGS